MWSMNVTYTRMKVSGLHCFARLIQTKKEVRKREGDAVDAFLGCEWIAFQLTSMTGFMCWGGLQAQTPTFWWIGAPHFSLVLSFRFNSSPTRYCHSGGKMKLFKTRKSCITVQKSYVVRPQTVFLSLLISPTSKTVWRCRSQTPSFEQTDWHQPFMKALIVFKL